MKKLFSILTILVLAVILAACDRRPVLKVFLPLEYMGEDFISEFNKNSEYRVELIEFESNEDMLSKYNTSTYDLIIPSDYALEELVSKDALLEMDWSRINTFKQSDIDESLMAAINMLKDAEVSFDLLKYGVPYFWGSFGIIYDKTKVTKTELEQKGWNILEDGREQMLYDSSRDMVMVGLKQHYANNEIDRSVNAPSKEDLAAVESWLLKINGSKTRIATEEVYDLMLNPTIVDLALAYSGDAAYLIDENPNLDYFVPVNQGTNVFIDAVVIPKTSSQIDFAYDFINYLLDKENAYQNSLELAFTSPRADVIEMILDNEDYAESAYKILFNEKDELFRYISNQDLVTEINLTWERAKS